MIQEKIKIYQLYLENLSNVSSTKILFLILTEILELYL